MTRCRLAGALLLSLALAPVAASSQESAAAPPVDVAVPPVAVTEAGPQLLTEELRQGIGDLARSGMQVVVHYTGWLYELHALGYRPRPEPSPAAPALAAVPGQPADPGDRARKTGTVRKAGKGAAPAPAARQRKSR